MITVKYTMEIGKCYKSGYFFEPFTSISLEIIIGLLGYNEMIYKIP